MLYQDDIIRATTSKIGAQDGLNRINKIMGEKLLDRNTDKSCHLIMANKAEKKKIEDEIELSPLLYNAKPIKQKVKEKWLGDQFHHDGLKESVNATLKDIIGRVKIGIFEVNAILEDLRMQVIGGIVGSFDIWELALIPMLLNNCDTWVSISDENIKELEDLQNLFFRTILQVPIGCPKPALCWETGTWKMVHRIMYKKLNFYKYLQTMDESSLAKKIFKEQNRLNFPGLVKECKEFAYALKIHSELENEIVTCNEFKRLVKNKINLLNEDSLREDMKTLSKCGDLKEGPYKRQDYFKELKVEDIRTKFRYRTKMIDVKFNFRNKNNYSKVLWLFDSCETSIESQSHVLWCPAYRNTRENKDLNSDSDLVQYIKKVLDI